ncbi:MULTISPECIES: D-alanyl-D-alanine carboxypeptidase family protein [Rhizobium]|uniref:serine-type D-Ala-D-Ala carboxypeptidase n=1 Tax=Rhizobium laguerreae TaxID=1076926 RepID=A0A7Y2RA02_9HYPH|nr:MULTISPECIES: D-alanyl-D-alanine carboxypeptidase family protein [Rhizobium]MBW8787465.1 D-alanyl-D-alanine carboxypeptidase [Rhizobium leguminosarum]MBY5365749.1 D-alanyl-D-alanine carboxypeptidase [Rhizobium leguminosarum]MBY5449164.1 D-alanyl-D-alanine carboxypeptidase [Rhizobium leguminosarum]NNH59358.1 D-alanyl-D-alanine carboxypeptidase [Rhizobium laguerreae]NNH66943.1 D-alanyl-D-alanine carboxypeptidase [Rhizobium laguerreae]
MLKPVLRLLACLMPFATGAFAADGGASGFATKAAQAYMIEAATGTVLLAKNEDQGFSPASLAKLMTMDLVFEAVTKGQITLDTEYPVSEYAWRTGGAPSRTATMFASLKSRVRVEDLIKGVAIQGANDSCIILAEGMAGSEQQFAASMTRRARELGMEKAEFGNSTGLPDGKSKVTAREMVTLAAALQQSYPNLYPYFAQPDFEWNKIFQRNRNPLLGLDLGADGLATGFTEGEGYSIVASVERDGRRLFLALAGIASDKERTEETKRVLEWGLTAFENRQIFAEKEVIGAASVYGGTSRTVDLVAKAPVSVYIPISNPDRLSARIIYHWPLTAPVMPDTQAGTLRIFAGSRLLREVPLYTVQAVGEGSLSSRAVDAMLELGESLFFSWLWDKSAPG